MPGLEMFKSMMPTAFDEFKKQQELRKKGP